MKRFLLFAIMCVCVSIGTWAQVPSGATAFGTNGSYWIVQDGVVTVHVEKAGDLQAMEGWNDWNYGQNVPWKNNDPQPKTLKFDPASTVSMADMGNANDFYILWQSNPYQYDFIDFSSLTDAQATDIITANQLKFGDTCTKGIIVPNKYSTDPGSFINKESINNYGINGSAVYANIKSNSTSNLAGVVAKVSGDVTSVNISGTATGSEVISAINSLTTATDVSISGKMHAGTNITIDNDVITDIDFSDLKPADGSTLNIDLKGCANLENVNLSGASVNNVDLTGLANLQTVNLDGTKIGGEVDVTGSLHDGLKITVASTDVAKIVPALDETQQAEYLDIVVVVPTPEGAWEDEAGCCWVSYDATTKVATVHAKKPGHFAAIFNEKKDQFADGTIFKFDSSCKPNADDLTVLAGEKTQWTSTSLNKYYVDLYEVPTEGTNIEAVITEAINTLRTNNWQYKGLLLPKNPTTVGTTLIQDSEQTATSIATCSQFITYVNGSTNVAHIYKASDEYNSASYQERFAAYEKVIELHSKIEENTTSYAITTNSTEKIDISTLRTAAPNATIVETINNEMVRTTATGNSSIYAYNASAGGFGTVVDETNIQNTNTELLELNGAVKASDITAISDFTNGPRVLDLRNATGLTAAMVAQIVNSHIEYILLPEGWEKADVNTAANTTNLTGLKAAISISDDGKNLVGYLGQAGSLAEARCLWEGGTAALGTDVTVDGVTYKRFTPTTTGTLENLTLSGNLNASDLAANIVTGIAVNIKNGNLYSDTSYNPGNIGEQFATDNGYQATTGVTAGSNGLNGEGNISYIDLTDAVFANQNDMNFNMLGLVNGYLSTVKLPTSSSMTTLPFASLLGSSGNVIDYLCIPSNFKNINRYALANTTVRCITTDNANHTVVIGANGEQFATDAEAKAACYDTFTFSSNIEFIGTGAVTPQSETITDVYVMATTTPRCEINAFSSGMLYGWGGFDGAGAYCRAKYTNGTKLFTMLHFPDQGNMTDAAYEQMKKNYTDVNKIYTKKDQTGAVDGNGDPIAWPSQGELYRAYTQASWGLTWNDWTTSYNPEVNTDGKGGYGAYRYPDVTAEATGTPSHEGDYPFADYIGWHQFVLSVATYFDQPDIIVENEKTVLQYVEGDWYTLCLPFSLTEDQLIEMLGVPKSEGNTISRLVDKNGTVIEESVSSRKLPDLRTLRSVTRTPNDPTVGNKNHIRFLLTNNLTETAPGTYQYWGINDANPSQSDYAGNGSVEGTGEKIALRGGYPYLVKPYIRYGETVTNLGKYILTRFASEFETDKLSCKRRDDCFEYLNGETETSKFAKPYEKHKIQAMLDVEGSERGYTKHKDGTKYYYAFVGQFWEQDLPRYAFYMVNNNWYRYTSGNKGWKWEPYKCIIMASQETANNTSERAHASSGLYRDDTKSVYPLSTGTDSKGAEIFDEEMEIKFLNGRDDAIFDSSNDSYAKFSFVFDDDIIDVTEDETTGIINLDGQDIQALPKNVKVYNAAGQFVGTSLDGLSKGLYIVNGKKYVVK